MNAARLRRQHQAEQAAAEVPSAAPAPEAAPVLDPAPPAPEAAPVLEPVPALPDFTADDEPEPVGKPAPITGNLDPLIEDILAEIPERPKRKPAEPVAELEAAPVATPAEKIKKAGPLLAAAGLVAGLLAAVVIGNRRPGAVPVPIPQPFIPGQPTPVAAPVAAPDPYARPGRVAVIGGRTHA